MPILKSAIKKQRQDKHRVLVNTPIRGKVKTSLKIARATPSTSSIAAFYSAVDRAVKHHLLNARAAARMKARLVKGARVTLSASPFAKK